MKINWRIRLLDKQFWLEIVPALLLLAQVGAGLFGYQLDLGDLGNKIIAVINALFAVLVILGVVRDPTTPGLSDSDRAMQYIAPGVLPDDTEPPEQDGDPA